MTEIPENIEAIARKSWDMAQRVAVQIAEKPPELREAAFAIAERSLRESAADMGQTGSKLEAWLELQMKLMRQFVQEIDVGGSPQGGTA